MKKGFTLIELLAVIVILAIIALIATPIVVDIIKDAKDSTQKTSINNIIRAAETYYASSLMNNDDELERNIYDEIIKNVKGEKPDSGIVYVNKDGKIAFSLNFNNEFYIKGYDDEECENKPKEEAYIPFNYLPVSTNTDENSYFLNGDKITKAQVGKIEFVTTNVVPSDAQGSWSVLGEENKNIMAWYYYNETTGLYDVYIGQEGGVKANPDSSYLFFRFINLTEINLTNLDTANVTNMRSMFGRCYKLPKLVLTNFDTSNVTNMHGLFGNCQSLETLDVSNLNTSNVTTMNTMFGSCKSLTELDLSNFDTSNVTDMGGVFQNSLNLRNIKLSSFDTSNVTNMHSMFNGCTNLEMLDLSNFNTSNVTTMQGMFQECENFKTLNLSSFNTLKVTNMQGIFNKAKIIDLNLNNWDFKNVTSYKDMFANSNITNIYIKRSEESFIAARLGSDKKDSIKFVD